jgi:translation initiation factor 3 subunit I
VWRTDTGERLGSYEGHNGSIWNLDVTPDTKHLLTASADNSCKVWDVCTGKELYSFEHETPCRNVSISCGGTMVAQAVYSQSSKSIPSHMKIYRLASDMSEQTSEVIARVGDVSAAHPWVHWCQVLAVLK